ncbi:MAG: DNA replication and repair protein RecF [Thermoleophilaceae bacterium]
MGPSPLTVSSVELRDFRNYERGHLELSDGLTVLAGPNGAGKTNLLEAVFFGCTARSPRTSNEREMLRHGAEVARVAATTREGDGTGHLIEVGFKPGEAKTVKIDGAPVDNLFAASARPLVSVFLPERLELVKGAPGPRRAHLDHLVAALWPARAQTRTLYSKVLAQRNALLARIRAGAASPDSLDVWDSELARKGVALMEDRAQAVDLLAPMFAARAEELGLTGDAALAYRPRSPAGDAEGLAAELRARRAADLERGFTAHGPHRDDLRLAHAERTLRNFGSQGQQRVALLALLFAERDLLTAERGRPPLMLLDDVMSELDPARRELLAGFLRTGGQALLTTTDLAHVPGAEQAGDCTVSVADGAVESAPARQAA